MSLVQQDVPAPNQALIQVPPGGPPTFTTTTLITDLTQVPQLTSRRTTDAHTALTRGVAQYLGGLAFVDGDGREVRFRAAFDHWAEPEDDESYPSVCVHSQEEARYDASNLTPSIPLNGVVTPDGYSLQQMGEYGLDMHADLYASDPEMRVALMMMCEDAFVPVDDIYGARLVLPHYFGQFADLTLEAATYMDDEASAQRGLRIARLRVHGAVAVLKARKIPQMSPRFQVSASTNPLPTTPQPIYSRSRP